MFPDALRSADDLVRTPVIPCFHPDSAILHDFSCCAQCLPIGIASCELALTVDVIICLPRRGRDRAHGLGQFRHAGGWSGRCRSGGCHLIPPDTFLKPPELQHSLGWRQPIEPRQFVMVLAEVILHREPDFT